MTAYWSRSATGKRYPYYNCQTRDCSEYRKSIRAEKIDGGFENILRSMTPSKNILDPVANGRLRLTQRNGSFANLVSQRRLSQPSGLHAYPLASPSNNARTSSAFHTVVRGPSFCG
ncbi:hypothetical protein [Litoreibacter albidus]|uniref:hypothetical protein n=1 Tax=Litoreibacter albidus TaxID=670155 RepID=UPI001FCE0158|nr:hypothetical protein [Litoreibacter albidus]